MHCFNIRTQRGGHLGFFVMLADNGAETGPKGGRFAVKLQSENPSDGPQTDMLRSLEQKGKPLLWHVEKDRIELFYGGRDIGSIRNEYPTLLGHSLVLNDLTETIWMGSMFILVLISIILAFVISYFFWWSSKNGQSGDLGGPAYHILIDDDSTDRLINKDGNDDPEKR